MEVVRFNEIKDVIVKNFRRRMLIPVIGAGFTKGCRSFDGVVPSGEEYRMYMLNQVKDTLKLSEEEIKDMRGMSFSDISDIYQRCVDENKRMAFYRNNFTKVKIEDYKIDFLNIPWAYVYTLNIDDGIEYSSDYEVVYSNRDVKAEVFNNRRCVLKLHGDVNDILTYNDSRSEIFGKKQYLSSLEKNRSLLTNLKHDSIYQNLIFVGCSLEDEIDLLYYSPSEHNEENITAKYICVVGKPKVLEKLKYEQYGITHCVVFDSYEQIYKDLTNAANEADSIAVDDLDEYKRFSVYNLSSDYEANKPYLLFGKSMISKDHKITVPHWFISREITSTIISNISHYTLQFMVGGGCSGKTYILVDLARKIKDRDVFLFETKDSLSEEAFKRLITKDNSIILADTTAFSNNQIEIILENLNELKSRNINIIIAVNKNDRELSGLLKLYELKNVVNLDHIPRIEVKNKFTEDEINVINPLLASTNVGLFDKNKTVVDNIMSISEQLTENNRYKSMRPKTESVRDIAALIALATERKIYSKRATGLDLYNEIEKQHKLTDPLIDCEFTWSFEKNGQENSPLKYVVNAEYWLYNKMAKYAENNANYDIIAKAYEYIINRIIWQEGGPTLLTNKNNYYKTYILFDNINRVFSFGNLKGADSLAVIRCIYERLNDILSVDPNYMHQRAKCYIKSSYYANNKLEKNKYLDKAYRDINVAYQTFKQRYDECKNEKLLISIEHICYTKALIMCHKCYNNEFSDIDANTNAIICLYDALISPYNSYDYVKSDTFNFNNVIGKIINTCITDKTLVESKAYQCLEELFKIIRNN